MSTALPEILLVSQVFPPAVGGSGQLLENVYSRIRSTQVTVLTDAASCRGEESRRGALLIRRTSLNGHYWGVLSVKQLAQHVRLARDLSRACRARPTVIHCGRAQPEAIPAVIARRFAPFPKYLFWVHGEEIIAALTSRDFSWTMRRVHADASFAITNSRNSARVLASVGFEPSRMRVVYPGVNGAEYHPSVDGSHLRRRFNAAPGRLLLSVGRLQRRKGHDLVIEALRALDAELPDLVYVIVGDGAERSRLELLVREHGLQGRVHFVGEIAAAELPVYYAAADVFVLPTRIDEGDFEGFGLVFLEAAASGKAVIGGRTGGVPEAVADQETGLLIEDGELGELVEAIRTLTTSPELRARYGAAGRRRTEREFTWERAAEAVLAIHAELAHSPA